MGIKKIDEKSKNKKSKNLPTGFSLLAIIGTIVVCIMFWLQEEPKQSTKPISQRTSKADVRKIPSQKIPSQKIPSKIEAWVVAEEFVKDYLKSPSTADFGGVWGGDYQNPETCVAYMGDSTYLIKGWVDSQNSFGATVRTDFLLIVKYKGNENWSLLKTPVMAQR